MSGWVAFDLDGTIAYEDGWKGEDYIGPPIERSIIRVKQKLAEGKEVRILTARASVWGRSEERRQKNIRLIQEWCKEHIGIPLEVTAEKDYLMEELYDDRCHRVEHNTGIVLE